MRIIVRNPAIGVYHPATPDYIHALEVQQPARILFETEIIAAE